MNFLTDRLRYIVLEKYFLVTRWKKDQKEFSVSLSKSKNADGSQSLICRVPRPVVNFLGNPEGLKFTIKGKNILVVAGDEK